MTKSEAISQLQEQIDLINKDYFDLQLDKYAEALQMAIEALNQFAGVDKKVSAEGRHKKDLISKADVCEILADVFPTDGEKVVYVEEIENAYQEIIALPSAQPEIIRCGECKHCYIDGENVRFNVCELNHNKAQSDDWFCADAERRADG